MVSSTCSVLPTFGYQSAMTSHDLDQRSPSKDAAINNVQDCTVAQLYSYTVQCIFT